jgi:hypothetical protein
MIDNTLQEGTMSFEELIAESNTLEVAGGETTTEETGAGDPTEETTEETVEETTEETITGKETQEETTEESEEEEQQGSENQEESQQLNSTLTSLAKKYLESGKWDDVLLDVEGEEVKLSELGDIDEETFLQIQEAQEELKQEGIKDKYIPKEGLNDISLKMIELQKNGGDITEALRVYNEYVNPLEGLDLSNESIQEQLVRSSLSKKIDDPDIIEMTINKYKKDLVLDQKANDVVEFTNKAFESYMEQKSAQAQEQKLEAAKAHKEYLKNLEEEFKATELKPDIKKQVLALANKNDKGEYEAVELVREQLQDPKLAQELLFFIGNREAYKKSIGSKTKTKTNIETMKKINLVKDKQKKQSGGSSKKDDNLGADFDFVLVDKL